MLYLVGTDQTYLGLYILSLGDNMYRKNLGFNGSGLQISYYDGDNTLDFSQSCRTYGSHDTELNIDEVKELRDFLNKFLEEKEKRNYHI